MGVAVGGCSAETLVRLKRQTQTTLSYAGLRKHAVRLGFAEVGALNDARWREIEERLFGVPFYRRRAT